MGGWGVRLGRREGLCASSALACLGDLNTPVDELDRRVVVVVSAYLTATATATCGHSAQPQPQPQPQPQSHTATATATAIATRRPWPPARPASATHHGPMGVCVNGSESERESERKRFRFRPIDHLENGSESESSPYTEGESSQAGMCAARPTRGEVARSKPVERPPHHGCL